MAIPLRDDVATRRFPWVTVGLIVANVVIFLFVQPFAFQNHPSDEELTIEPPPSAADYDSAAAYRDATDAYLQQRPADVRRAVAANAAVADANRFSVRWGAIACEVRSGAPLAELPGGCPPPCVLTFETSDSPVDARSEPDDGRCVASYAQDGTDAKNPYVALFTSIFLHGSILHLAGNMLFLWVFGNNVEDRLGRLRYLLVYVGGGVLATLGFVAVNIGSEVPLVGASGAIAVAMGAYLVFHPRGRVLTIVAPASFQLVYLPAAVVLAWFFVTQFFTGEESVAWEAHAAGVIVGVLAALILGRSPAVRDRAAEDRNDELVRGGRAF